MELKKYSQEMKTVSGLILVGWFVTCLLLGTVDKTLTYFNNTETGNNNTFTAWTPTKCTQTTQTDFNDCALSNVDLTSSPGDVQLALSNATTHSPTNNTGSAWTNPTNAYDDGGTGHANITSGNPSGSNVWGTYGFTFTNETVTRVRVRYDAWYISVGGITYRGAGTPKSFEDTSDTGVVAKPMGTASTDILILKISSDLGGGLTINPPSGWTLMVRTNGSSICAAMYWASGDVASTTFSFSASNVSGIAWIEGYIGVDSATPMDATALGQLNVSSVNVTTPSITTVTNGAMLTTAHFLISTDSTTFTEWSEGTETIDSQFNMQNNNLWVNGEGVYAIQTQAGASGTKTSTASAAAINIGLIGALKPATQSAPYIKVDVSWDGGTSWSSTQDTSLTTSETTYWYDVTSATSWTPAKLNDSNFKVSALAETVSSPLVVNLDWLAVDVTYGVSSGTIVSQVQDTGIVGARWDAFFWDTTLPTGANITFEVRISDTLFTMDDSSPSWTSIGGISPVTLELPSGRYQQWRATLTTSDISNTPTLHELRVYYH